MDPATVARVSSSRTRTASHHVMDRKCRGSLIDHRDHMPADSHHELAVREFPGAEMDPAALTDLHRRLPLKPNSAMSLNHLRLM